MRSRELLAMVLCGGGNERMEREKNGPGRNGEGRGYEVTVERFPHVGIPVGRCGVFVCKALLFLFFRWSLGWVSLGAGVDGTLGCSLGYARRPNTRQPHQPSHRNPQPASTPSADSVTLFATLLPFLLVHGTPLPQTSLLIVISLPVSQS